MRANVPDILDELKDYIKLNSTLKNYSEKKGCTAFCRFWNLFRTDIMRKDPKEMADFLKNIDEKSKLAELEESGISVNFGKKLAEKYFDNTPEIEQRKYQRDLIHTCLEMDAACKLNNAEIDEDKNIDKIKKNKIMEMLNLWSLPCKKDTV